MEKAIVLLLRLEEVLTGFGEVAIVDETGTFKPKKNGTLVFY